MDDWTEAGPSINWGPDGYSDPPQEIQEALERSVPVADFLPPPEQLVFRTEKQKVTMMLDKEVVDFFKRAAQKNDGKYQPMINSALRSYMKAHN